MINEQLLEDFGATLPRDVGAAPREEAGDRVPCEVVDPAFLAQLPHDGVDPGEAGGAVRPAVEPGVFLGIVYFVGACDQVVGGVDFAGEVPGDEAAVGVVVWMGMLAMCILGSMGR